MPKGRENGTKKNNNIQTKKNTQEHKMQHQKAYLLNIIALWNKHVSLWYLVNFFDMVLSVSS